MCVPWKDNRIWNAVSLSIQRLVHVYNQLELAFWKPISLDLISVFFSNSSERGYLCWFFSRFFHLPWVSCIVLQVSIFSEFVFYLVNIQVWSTFYLGERGVLIYWMKKPWISVSLAVLLALFVFFECRNAISDSSTMR